MATENKGVMVYLPKEVEEYITEFCTEYSITRKDKEGNILPSLGTGIVTYLKSQMSGESPGEYMAKPSKSLGNGLTKDEVLDLIREYNTSHTPSNGLTKDEVLDLIEQSITPIDSPQSIGAIEKLVIAQIEPLAASFEELEIYTQTQFKAVREELEQAKSASDPLNLSIATDLSWGVFHQAVGLETSNSKKSTELGAIAIAKATEMGFVGWKYNSNKQRFQRQ